MFTLWALVFAAGTQAMLVTPIIPQIATQLGVEEARLGILVTSYAVPVGVFALVTGPVPSPSPAPASASASASTSASATLPPNASIPGTATVERGGTDAPVDRPDLVPDALCGPMAECGYGDGG